MLKVRPIGRRADAALAMLRAHPVLGGAPDAVLMETLQRSNLVTAPTRERLFRQDDDGRAVAFVLSGFLKVSSMTANGREVVLEICGPGSLFGELAVLNGWPRAADVTALCACEVVSIPGEAFRTLLTRSPDAMFALLGVLSRRLRRATDQLRDELGLPGPARLAKALGELAALHGVPGPLGLQIDVALSQSELGGLTGLSRETINRHLSAWRDAGWLDLNARHVTLRAAEALRQLVEDAHDE